MSDSESAPVRIAITGAAGQIAYSLLFHIADGQVFGPHRRVILQLLEIPPALPALEGTIMELRDCAFPLVDDIVATVDPEVAFRDVNWALLVGSKPRGKGQERKDLIRDNGPIFIGQGKAIGSVAAPDVRILVVGNPCNTNCLIARSHAGNIAAERWFAMTRLDHSRALAQLSHKCDVPARDVKNVTIWGNHSSTLYADVSHATVRGKPAADVIGDDKWISGEFLPTVRQRGAAIIQARGKSSAASAAKAVVDHLRFFLQPSPEGEWTSAAVVSDGSYDIPEGLIASFPVRSTASGWDIVRGLEMNDAARAGIKLSVDELVEERDTVKDLLG